MSDLTVTLICLAILIFIFLKGWLKIRKGNNKHVPQPLKFLVGGMDIIKNNDEVIDKKSSKHYRVDGLYDVCLGIFCILWIIIGLAINKLYSSIVLNVLIPVRIVIALGSMALAAVLAIKIYKIILKKLGLDTGQ